MSSSRLQLFWIEQDLFQGKGRWGSSWRSTWTSASTFLQIYLMFFTFPVIGESNMFLHIFKSISPWRSQPPAPGSLLSLQAAPGAMCQPSPPSLKLAQSYLNPASSPLNSTSPLIALNIPRSLNVFTFHSLGSLSHSSQSPLSKSVSYRSGVSS